MADSVRIIADSFFSIGKTHQVCEDYCISGENPNPYVILADGCSSSKNTDVGARLLVHSAEELLARFKFEHEAALLDLGAFSIRKAETVCGGLGMPRESLDATLVVAFSLGESFNLITFGDAIVAIKHKEQIGDKDLVRVYSVKYADEMPYYLSYSGDIQREKLYREINIKKHKNSSIQTVWDSWHDTEYKYPFYTREKFIRMQWDCFDWVMIASDGLDSFRNMKTGEAIPLQDIVKRFTSFKVTKGEFMKRTARKALKELAKENIFPMDDISLGCLLIKRDKENRSVCWKCGHVIADPVEINCTNCHSIVKSEG